MIIAVDLDGTIIEHKYPAIGKEIPFALETLGRLQIERYKLILWSIREDKPSDEAVTLYRERDLEFYVMNRDYPEEEGSLNNHFSRRLKVGIFIDDRNLDDLPGWGMIYEMVNKRLSYENLIQRYESEYEPEKPKGLLSRLFH